VPARPWPGALGRDQPLAPQLAEHEPDRRRADAGQRALDIAASKLRGRLAQDVLADSILLGGTGPPPPAAAMRCSKSS
jgi:hypothetical protein